MMTNHSIVLEEVNDLFWIANEKAHMYCISKLGNRKCSFWREVSH